MKNTITFLAGVLYIPQASLQPNEPAIIDRGRFFPWLARDQAMAG